MAGSKILRVVVQTGQVAMSSMTLNENGQVTAPMRTEASEKIVSLSSDSLTRRTLDALVDLLERSRESREGGQERQVRCLQVLGEHLFELVFQGRVRERLVDTLEELSARAIDVLRVELEFPPLDDSSGWLTGLPWEYLRTPSLEPRVPGQFLAMTAQIVLNRVLSLGLPPRELPTKPPWSVLLVCPSPPRPEVAEGLLPVTCEPVREAIRRLGTGKMRLNRLVERPWPAVMDDGRRCTVTREAFAKAIKQFAPNIIHFVGHGRRRPGVGELAFLKENGEIDWVDDVEVARLVSEAADLKLVFLQACDSALPDPYLAASGLAQRIASLGIPAVVAMQHRVEAEIANAFARGFYQGLADGQHIDRAVGSGREQIRAMNTAGAQLDFGLPVLYLQGYQAMVLEPSPASTPASGASSGTTVRCSRCKKKVPNNLFCGVCKARLLCVKCSKPLDRPDFCTKCGTDNPQRPWSPPGRGGRAGWSATA